ncbi:1170_t:CDS:2, partial [Gigaspora margarita]
GTNNENNVIKVCKKDSDKKKIDEKGKRNMMVSSMSMDEICRDDTKLNDISKADGIINSIEHVDETSNKGKTKYDIELKIGINDDNNDVIVYNCKNYWLTISSLVAGLIDSCSSILTSCSWSNTLNKVE